MPDRNPTEGLRKNKKKAGQRGEIGRKDNKIKDNSCNIQCMVMGEYINIKHDLTEYKNQHKVTLTSQSDLRSVKRRLMVLC
jgi:hypothetical protein